MRPADAGRALEPQAAPSPGARERLTDRVPAPRDAAGPAPSPAVPAAAPAQLGPRVRRALAWSLLNNAFARAGGLLVSIVLARLLVPADYGTFAVALVVLTALLSVNELGVTLAIVRWPGPVERIASTVNAIAIAASVVVAGAGVLSAGALATALGAPEAEGVIRLLCLAALVDGACSVPAALLTRDFRQKETAFIESAGLVAASCVSLGLAFRGHGAYSLAWGQLVGNALVGFLLVLRCRPYPGLRLRPSVLRPLLRFGIPLAGSSALVFAMLNLDYIVVGRLLGSTQLGLYFLAFNLASAPANFLSIALRRVTMPAFARTRDSGGDLAASFAQTLSLVLMVVLPGCVFLSVHASALLDLVYGDRWGGASGALTVLALFAVVRVVADLAYDLLATLGRSRSVLAVQASWLACLGAALPLGAHLGGIRGVAAGHLVIGVLVVIPAFLVALHHAGLRTGPLARATVRPAAAAAVVATTGLSFGVVLRDTWLVLLVGALVAAVATAALSFRQLAQVLPRALHPRVALTRWSSSGRTRD